MKRPTRATWAGKRGTLKAIIAEFLYCVVIGAVGYLLGVIVLAR